MKAKIPARGDFTALSYVSEAVKNLSVTSVALHVALLIFTLDKEFWKVLKTEGY